MNLFICQLMNHLKGQGTSATIIFTSIFVAALLNHYTYLIICQLVCHLNGTFCDGIAALIFLPRYLPTDVPPEWHFLWWHCGILTPTSLFANWCATLLTLLVTSLLHYCTYLIICQLMYHLNGTLHLPHYLPTDVPPEWHFTFTSLFTNWCATWMALYIYLIICKLTWMALFVTALLHCYLIICQLMCHLNGAFCDGIVAVAHPLEDFGYVAEGGNLIQHGRLRGEKADNSCGYSF